MADAFMHTGQAAMLEAERRRASFNVEEMTVLLDGSPEATAKRRKIRAAIETDPIFENGGRIFMTRSERYKRALIKFRRAEEIVRGITGLESSDIKNMNWLTAVPFIDDFPMALHCLMFIPNLKVLCTEDQLRTWLTPSENFTVIGCYAQTELGHGSNVRGLETTASYMPADDQFEIHTPSLSAIKFWPGSLGCTANHAMVLARLKLDGVDHGVHNFIVPIRDMKTHAFLPGITGGDIGPKIGYNNMDNGWCRFDRVRIPRTNMAMKFASVTRDGKLIKSTSKVHDKVAYVTMMEVRALIVVDCRLCLAKACTIAIRYNTVRRQGGGPPKKETTLLDYATQQHRLFPLLATCYALHFSGLRIVSLLAALRTHVPLGKTEGLGPAHATLSGLKALCTIMCSDGIEECRRCCGGQGYLMASGLPELLGYALHYITAEGDSHVLAQQASRYLLKALATARAGDASLLVGECAYLSTAHDLARAQCTAALAADMLTLDLALTAHRSRAARLLLALGARIEALMSDGMTPQDAWMAVQIDQHRAALAHAMATMVGSFVDSVRHVPGKIGDALRRMCSLFALHNMELSLGDFLEGGYLSPAHAPMLREAIRDLLHVVRPDAVALVEAFDLSDISLASAIGSRSGEAYRGLYESARRSETEQQGVAYPCPRDLAKL